MSLSILAGSAHPALADAVARRLGRSLVENGLERFPDGEVHVRISGSVRGADVYVVQPTSPPVEANLIELLLLADAGRRAGARRVTTVIPYFGYARQDRRVHAGEALGARVVADLLGAVHVDRVIAVDLHAASVEGFLAMPLEHRSAVPLLLEALRPLAGAESVVVAPDLGAAKLAERFGAILGLPVAVVRKTRVSGSAVEVRGVSGEVRGRKPILVDDMISTGGTIEAAVRAVRAAGARPGGVVAASHGLFVGPAVERLAAAGLERIVVANGVPPVATGALPVERVDLAPLLAATIEELHSGEPVDDPPLSS